MAKQSSLSKELKELLTDPDLSLKQMIVIGAVVVGWTILPVDDLIGFGIGTAAGPLAGILSPLLAWGDELLLWPWFLNAIRVYFKSQNTLNSKNSS